jgi:hypothetical protein
MTPRKHEVECKHVVTGTVSDGDHFQLFKANSIKELLSLDTAPNENIHHDMYVMAQHLEYVPKVV